MATAEQLANWFTYHPPQGDQVQRYQGIREAGKRFANLINEFVPDSPEKKEAIDRVREAVMWANAGIACNQPKLPPNASYTTGGSDAEDHFIGIGRYDEPDT